VDRARSELVVLNSNRMTIIDRIAVPDPTALAMSPNLDTIAITSQTTGIVSFVDIDPDSATFHQVIQSTVVGSQPRGICWESGNEDIIVANEGDNSISILSAFSLEVRRVISSNLSEPFEIATTPRQINWGFFRNVYFGYIANRNGRVAVFESGPNEVNGWGFDDVIGVVTTIFRNPKTIQPDHVDLRSGFWIAHEGAINLETGDAGPAGEPAVTKVNIVSGIQGQLPLNVTSLLIPNFRDLVLEATSSIGPTNLAGIPVDLAFDNMRNLGGLANLFSVFGAGVPLPLNGKSLVRTFGANPNNTNEPSFMFVAVPNPVAGIGAVEVIQIDGGFQRVDTNPFQPGDQPIVAPNVQVLMDYWRQ
ncbi:MAG: hypothetical protein AAGG08_19125, partial [Actinomycetota bacterium]